MKKSLLFFVLVLSYCLNAYSQATSLTVDCQNPGWLSSMINYGDQQTLESIKVTGYINGTDIKFIREMNLNRNLSGVIDLEDANIVAGGESYGHFDGYGGASANPVTKDNTITEYMFANLKNIRKVILPKSTLEFTNGSQNGYQFHNTRIDTLIINGSMTNITVGRGYNNITWNINCYYFSNGLSTIQILSRPREVFFPSTMKKLTYGLTTDETIFHCESKEPDKITRIFADGSINNTIFDKGRIYIPRGTTEKYKNSIFRLMNIIEDIQVEGITIDNNKSLYVGDEVILQAQVIPSDALNKKIEWDSSNPNVVEVYEDGIIKAIAYGTADITARTEDGGYEATCSISVYEHTTGIEMVDEITIPIDETYTLNAQTLPLSTSDDIISYLSSNDEIVSVNSQGKLTANKKGKCTITATSVDGGYTATCEVTVIQPVESLTMEKHSITLKVGESEKLFAQISPATADDKTISWHSSNEQIASVNANGNVSAKKAGEVWIKAISNDNAEAKDSCKVIVSQPVTGIQLDKMTYQLNGIGNSFELKATVTPDDASNKNIKWKSTDETVCVASHGQANASVNPNCTITSTGKGTCSIIASTEDGGYTAICIVTVAIPKYKLIYKVDGEVYKTYELEQGLIITPEPAPTKEGYTFSGWNEMPETMPTHDVTVTGTFTINKYNLTYNVDGEEYKTVEVEYGKEITPETEPTKDGYVFSGWVGLPATMPAKDVTVAGTFSKGAFKLIYLVDGEVYKTMAYNLDDAITPEPAPTKEGYTFSGWSEIPATMPANDVTVTGTFTINKYKLIYNVDGEEYKTVEVEYGKAITPESEPTKDGYVFSGWVGLPATMPAKDVTVAGSFNKEEFKLIYLVDGEVYKTMVYSLGDAITPEAEPEEEGYTFSGWSEIPATMPAEDVTVIGTFTINKYKLTYVIDGDEYKSIEIEYGKTITPEAEPTKEGYTFSGWGTIPTTMPAKDVTISGTFSKGAYKLVYKVDDVAYKTVSYDFGDAITPEAEPTKEGYTFSGWSEIPATMPAEDLTVSGTFTVNKYKLTYVIDGETYKTYEVEYGAAIKIEPDPTKEGFDFSGWDNVPQAMPAEDVTITGTFTPTTGIAGIVTSGKPFDIYSLSGVLLKRYVTSFDGLPAGLYIVNGRKVHVK